MIAASPWYTDLRLSTDKKYLPLYNEENVLIAVDVSGFNFVYGPSFVVLILIFLSTLATAVMYAVLYFRDESKPREFFAGSLGRDNDEEAAGGLPQTSGGSSEAVKLS